MAGAVTLKGLIIEDNPDHVELIEDMLVDMSFSDIHVNAVNTLEQGRARLIAERFDCCVCDLKLPDSSIDNTIAWLSSVAINVPTITLTSINDDELAQSLISKGVQDYIAKEELSPRTLSRALRYAIERWQHQQKTNEHNKDMRVFCRSLSHDFNGHISRINGVSASIKDNFTKRYELDEQDEKWFSFLDTSTHAIHALVTDLQQYLTVEYASRDFVMVPILHVFDRAKQSMEASLNEVFYLHYDMHLPSVRCNPALIQIMLQNLISNSVKFCEDDAIIHLSVLSEETFVKIIVEDNGVGIDNNRLDEVFYPFFRLTDRLTREGSGLGLSIVKRIVEHHKGTIDIYSSREKGSIFTITLPTGETI